MMQRQMSSMDSSNSLLPVNGSDHPHHGLQTKDTYNSFGDNASITSFSQSDDGDPIYVFGVRLPSLRRIAMQLSLGFNLLITVAKLVAYIQTLSLSVLAALLDSVLDVVSQIVLNYTEKHSSMSRSSAFYPAGASRLEPIGVLTCAGMQRLSPVIITVCRRDLVKALFHFAFMHILTPVLTLVASCSIFSFDGYGLV